MNLRTSLLLNKKYLKLLSIIFLIGFLISYIIYQKMDNTNFIKELSNITTYLKENPLNYILIHIITISLLLTSSLCFIGILLIPCYILFEVISIIYSLLAFINAFKLPGLIFGVFYALLTKGLFIILLLIIYKKILNIYKTIFNKTKNEHTSSLLIKNIKEILILITIILLNDIFIYFFLNKILLKLSFIISF